MAAAPAPRAVRPQAQPHRPHTAGFHLPQSDPMPFAQEMAPMLPFSTGKPSWVSEYGRPTKGSGWTSGREKRTAVSTWCSDRMLMTRCASPEEGPWA